jgi:hypothetical protein
MKDFRGVKGNSCIYNVISGISVWQGNAFGEVHVFQESLHWKDVYLISL